MSARMDGGNYPGFYAVYRACELAIDKARGFGFRGQGRVVEQTVCQLAEAGFKIGKVEGNTLLPLSYASIADVLANPGDMVPRGSTVDLFFETD